MLSVLYWEMVVYMDGRTRMRKILVALVAISFALAATLSGCGQKTCGVAVYDGEEVIYDSTVVVVEEMEDEEEIIISDDEADVIIEGDIVVVEEPVVTTVVRRETEQEALERKVRSIDARLKSDSQDLDEIIERQLGHVPSYTYAPHDKVVEEVIEEIIEEVEIVVDDDDDEIIEVVEIVTAAKPAPKTAKAPVAEVKAAAASEAQVAARQTNEVSKADYQKFTNIDAYDAEFDEESAASAMTVAPAVFASEPAPVIETKPAPVIAPPAPITTAQSANAAQERTESLKLPFDFPPAPVNTATQSGKTNDNSLSMEGFEDDGLEFFGQLSDSLLDEKEG